MIVRWPEGVFLNGPPRREYHKVCDGNSGFGAGARQYREDGRVLRSNAYFTINFWPKYERSLHLISYMVNCSKPLVMKHSEFIFSFS